MSQSFWRSSWFARWLPSSKPETSSSLPSILVCAAPKSDATFRTFWPCKPVARPDMLAEKSL